MIRRNRASLRLRSLVELSPQASSFSRGQPPDPARSDLSSDLLNRLFESEAARLLALATRVDLAPRQVLSHGELPMENVYIIEAGLVSVMAKADKNQWVEAWMVGSEGLVGLPALLTDGHSANRRVVQIGGTALRFSSRAFQDALDSSKRLRSMGLQCLGFLLLQASQIGACNAQHTAMERVTRWLLLASHAICERRISVSHDVLARAIGLRRATVSDCLKQLETHGAVKTSRRLIEIADARAVQSFSCDCYNIITRRRQRYATPAPCF